MTAVGYQETAIYESVQQDTNQQTTQSQRFPEIQDGGKKSDHGLFNCSSRHFNL